jgi:cobalt-precorrin 5A hydrolase
MEQIGIAAFTDRGRRLASRIGDGLSAQYQISFYQSELKNWCRGQFEDHSAGIIFVGATGIAVRTIAPYLCSKTTDPAVLVIDEAGQYVISLLSGHIGGANRLAEQVAAMIGACPVITTATDVNGKFAVDVFARANGLRIGSMKAAKEISAAILRGERIGVYCEGRCEGSVPPELTLLPSDCAGMPVTEILEKYQVRHLIWIAEKQNAAGEATVHQKLQATDHVQEKDTRSGNEQPENECEPHTTVLDLYARPYILGLGCRKEKSEGDIRSVVEELLGEQKISWQDIGGAASIDLKKEEPGLLSLCRRYDLPFETYSAEQLRSVQGEFSASGFVQKTTGVDNVCERAALCMAGAHGRLVHRKYAKNGVTASLAVRDWSVRFEE